jgi:hypothetical protein
MLADTTITQPLHHHNCRQLRVLQTLGSWSDPCPLSPISRLIDRWSPWTMMPHCEAITVIHGWGSCPNLVAPMVGSSSRGHNGEEEGKEEEPWRISVVSGLVQGSLISWMMRITVSPRGRPQGPLVPRTTMPPASSTPSLTAPPVLAPPPSEASPSEFVTLLDLKSLCGNCIIQWLARMPRSSTQWPGQAVEQWWRKGSGTEEEEQGSGYNSAPKEVTEGRACVGARGGGQDLVTMDPARPTRSSERAE